MMGKWDDVPNEMKEDSDVIKAKKIKKGQRAWSYE